MTRSHSSRLLAAGIAVLIAFNVSAAEPKQPVKVCIENAPGCGTTPDQAPREGIKWHPGHYVYLDDVVAVNNISQRRQLHFRQISSLDADPEVKGIKVQVYWAVLEGPTAGDYSQGFEVIDSYLQKLGSLKTPRRLMLVINERAFGKYGPERIDAIRSILPAYLLTPEYNGGYVTGDGSGGLGLSARIWETPTMDRLIALSQALAKRYDNHPLFEMVGFNETTFGIPGSKFDLQAYHAQLRRWFDASKKVWTHTQLRLTANFGGSDTNLRALIDYCIKGGGVAVGGPDPELPLPTITRGIKANIVYRGERGGTDLRGVAAWVGEQQGMGLGRSWTLTPDVLFDYQYSTMHANYMIWTHNQYLGGDEQKWSTGILPFIRSIKGKTHTECPSLYNDRCVTR